MPVTHLAIDGPVATISLDHPQGNRISFAMREERFAKQMEMSLPTRKRLWQQIVRAKIKAQGELLRELHGNDHGLIAMLARVREMVSSSLPRDVRDYLAAVWSRPPYGPTPHGSFRSGVHDAISAASRNGRNSNQG
jgi:hypothetical protein